MAARTSSGGGAEAAGAADVRATGASSSSKPTLPNSNITPGVRTSALLLASQLPPPLLELLPRMHSSGFLSDLLEMHANGLLESIQSMREELGGSGVAAATAAAALSLGLVKGKGGTPAAGWGNAKLTQGVSSSLHELKRSRVVSASELSKISSGAALPAGPTRSVSAAPSASGAREPEVSPVVTSAVEEVDTSSGIALKDTASPSTSSRPLSGRKGKAARVEVRADVHALPNGEAEAGVADKETEAGAEGNEDKPIASSSKRTITVKRPRAAEEGGKEAETAAPVAAEVDVAEEMHSDNAKAPSSKRRKSLKSTTNSTDSSSMSNREVHTRVALASGLRPVDSRASTPVPTDEERAWAEEQARREKILEQDASSKPSRRRRSSAKDASLVADDAEDGLDEDEDDEEDPNARRSARTRKTKLVFSPPPGDVEIRRRRGILPNKKGANKPQAQPNGIASDPVAGPSRSRTTSGRKSISWGDATADSSVREAASADDALEGEGVMESPIGSEVDELASDDDDDDDETDVGSSDSETSDYYEPKKSGGSSSHARRSSGKARSSSGATATRARSTSGSALVSSRSATSPTTPVSPAVQMHNSAQRIRRGANGRFADRKSDLPPHSPPMAADVTQVGDASQISVDALPLPRAVPGAQLHWCYICTPPHPYDKRGSLRQHYTRLRRKGIRVENGGPGGGGKKADPIKDRMRGILVQDENNGETVVVSPLSQHRRTSTTPGGGKRKASAPLTPGSPSYDASYVGRGGSMAYGDVDQERERVGGSTMDHDRHAELQPPLPLMDVDQDGMPMADEEDQIPDEVAILPTASLHPEEDRQPDQAIDSEKASSSNLYDASTNLFAATNDDTSRAVSQGPSTASSVPAHASAAAAPSTPSLSSGKLKVTLKRSGNGNGSGGSAVVGAGAGGTTPSSSGAATPLHNDESAIDSAAKADEDVAGAAWAELSSG